MQRALLRKGLLFFCAVFSFAQESSGANSGDLFFLDLGIIIKTLYIVIFRKNVHSASQEIMPEFMGTSGDKIDD